MTLRFQSAPPTCFVAQGLTDLFLPHGRPALLRGPDQVWKLPWPSGLLWTDVCLWNSSHQDFLASVVFGLALRKIGFLFFSSFSWCHRTGVFCVLLHWNRNLFQVFFLEHIPVRLSFILNTQLKHLLSRSTATSMFSKSSSQFSVHIIFYSFNHRMLLITCCLKYFPWLLEHDCLLILILLSKTSSSCVFACFSQLSLLLTSGVPQHHTSVVFMSTPSVISSCLMIVNSVFILMSPWFVFRAQNCSCTPDVYIQHPT